MPPYASAFIYCEFNIKHQNWQQHIVKALVSHAHFIQYLEEQPKILMIFWKQNMKFSKYYITYYIQIASWLTDWLNNAQPKPLNLGHEMLGAYVLDFEVLYFEVLDYWGNRLLLYQN